MEKGTTDVFRLHGKALKILRISNGLKSVEVAKALNVSIGYISHCEQDRKKLSEAKTKEFLEFIGTNEDEAKAFTQIVGH